MRHNEPYGRGQLSRTHRLHPIAGYLATTPMLATVYISALDVG